MSSTSSKSFKLIKDGSFDSLKSKNAYIDSLYNKAPFLLHAPDDKLENSLVIAEGNNVYFNNINDELFVNSSGGGGGGNPGQVLYVRQNGNDMTGDGSEGNPYATIVHTMTSITDSSWEKRYMIDIGPGNWNENINWKAWVFSRGNIVQATRVTGSVDVNDPSWSIAGSHSDARAGAQDVSFTGNINLDWSLNPISPNTSYGKFYFWNCNINNTLNGTGIHPVNQIIISGGFTFGGANISGLAMTTIGISGQAGNIILNSTPTLCSYTGFGGASLGGLVLNYTSGNNLIATLLNQSMGSVSLTGSQASLSATNSYCLYNP